MNKRVGDNADFSFLVDYRAFFRKQTECRYFERHIRESSDSLDVSLRFSEAELEKVQVSKVLFLLCQCGALFHVVEGYYTILLLFSVNCQ